jgi:hypothetical protein
MGCGSCGKRRRNSNNIQVKRSAGTQMQGKQICPICRSVMRSLHKFDKSVKKVIKSWYCTKPSCPNSRGSK